ncbi:MAG: type III-A CRISPR-associated protein Csm2 [Lachnospiraceae bacterium]|nr:type III-A CRISPR-associated protein Csm2 [Lachnospiraceae bacterium]
MILKNDTYVAKAEKAIKTLAEKKHGQGRSNMVTTTQLRNLLATTADIYNEVCISMDERLSEDIRGRINYLKVRFLYEAGRELQVKKFVDKAQIIKAIDEVKGSRKNYILFNKYMEALVAYHRFYGGKD